MPNTNHLSKREKTIFTILVFAIPFIAFFILAITWTSNHEAEPITEGEGITWTNAQAGAIRVDVWTDWACSHCHEFDTQYGPALEAAADENQIDLHYHPINILRTDLSTWGARADYWIATNRPDLYQAWHTTAREELLNPYWDGTLTETLTIDLFSQTAHKAGLGTDTTTFTNAITGTTLDTTLTDELRAAMRAGLTGTPTIAVDGEILTAWTDIESLLP